jgi:hypothetical protein
MDVRNIKGQLKLNFVESRKQYIVHELRFFGLYRKRIATFTTYTGAMIFIESAILGRW